MAPTATVTTGEDAPTAAAPGPQVKLIDPVAQGLSVGGVTRLCDDNLRTARDIIAAIKKTGAQVLSSTNGHLFADERQPKTLA